MKHTQGKWIVIDTEEGKYIIYNSQQEYIGTTNKEANARRIVHCANNFDELLSILKRTSKFGSGLLQDKIEQAIAKAEEK